MGLPYELLYKQEGTARRFGVRSGQSNSALSIPHTVPLDEVVCSLGMVTLSSTPWSSVLLEERIVPQLVKKLHCTVSESSLPCSQQPTTRPSPELEDQSIPRCHPNS